jgi:hypothetical protein
VRGGRLALNVWGALDRQPGMLAIVEVVADFLGRESQSAFDMACSLNTRQELCRLAEDAGLRNVHVRFEHRTMRYPNAADYVAAFMGATPITAQFVALSAAPAEMSHRLGRRRWCVSAVIPPMLEGLRKAAWED